MRSARSSKGFTLIEVLVAAALTAIGISALVGALGVMTRTQSRMLEKEVVEQLADRKLNELTATQEYETSTEGTFDDPDLAAFSWESEVQSTGDEAITYLVVTISKENSDVTATASRLVYSPPDTGETGP